MIFGSKKRELSWLEQYVLHYRKQMPSVREDIKAENYAKALRTLSSIYTSASLLADYCQRHAITLTEGALPAQVKLAGTDYKEYNTALLLDTDSILTSYIVKRDMPSHNDLLQGDEIAAMVQQEHLAKALDTIAKDKRGLFKVVAHHPSLMRRMSAFAGEKGPIRRTFTLSVDNDIAISEDKVFFRRRWLSMPAAYMTRDYLMVKCAKATDDAGLIAENLVEHACYTEQPVLNGVFVLWYEATNLKRMAGELLQKIAREIRGRYAKYSGFTGWNKEVKQAEALAIQYAPGIVALSGAPIVSVKTASNASLPIIKTLIANKMASAEAQQLNFLLKSAGAGSDCQWDNWELSQQAFTKLIEAPMKKSFEAAKKERKVLRDIKV